FVLRRVAIQHDCGQEIVTVGEDVRFDNDAIANDTFRRKEAAIDLRLHTFDDDASPAVELRHGRPSRYKSRARMDELEKSAEKRAHDNSKRRTNRARAENR